MLAPADRTPAQTVPFDVQANYVKRDTMIAMRDGVKLYTIIYTPRDTTRTYPILLFRTPYSIRPYEPDVYRQGKGIGNPNSIFSTLAQRCIGWGCGQERREGERP
jgi:uncharacterized protein